MLQQTKSTLCGRQSPVLLITILLFSEVLIGCGASESATPRATSTIASPITLVIPTSTANATKPADTKVTVPAPIPTNTQPQATTVTIPPMLKVSAYNIDSPERAMAEFLTAWKAKVWTYMRNFTQGSWRTNTPNPEKWLENNYGLKDLQSAEIISSKVQSPTIVDVTARVYYSVDKLYIKLIIGRVIKELRPGSNNPAFAEWGVNPVSTLREDD